VLVRVMNHVMHKYVVQNVRDCSASLNVSISHTSSVIVQSCNCSPPKKNSLPFFKDEGVNDAN